MELSLFRTSDPAYATILGGMGTLLGPLIGGYLWNFIRELFRVAEEIRILANAVFVILIIRFYPEGAHGLLQTLRRAFLRILGERTR